MKKKIMTKTVLTLISSLLVLFMIFALSSCSLFGHSEGSSASEQTGDPSERTSDGSGTGQDESAPDGSDKTDPEGSLPDSAAESDAGSGGSASEGPDNGESSGESAVSDESSDGQGSDKEGSSTAPSGSETDPSSESGKDGQTDTSGGENVIHDAPPAVTEEPDPEADHEHKWELESTTKGDDHTKPYTETYKCSVCGAEKNKVYPAEVHDFNETVTDPTCTEKGYVTHRCDLCGYTYRDNYTDALGHRFGQWTKEDDGTEVRTCTVCGEKETRKGSVAEGTCMVVSSADAKAGDTVELTVSLKENPGICAFALSFKYDDSALTLENVVPSDSIGGQFNFAKKAAWINSSDYKDDGVILTLSFKVDNGAKGEYPVAIEYVAGDVCNYDEEDVDFTIVPGTINVK